MIIVPIPPWTAAGVIPPVNLRSATGADRSPYTVSLSDVVLQLGTTRERRAILDGLLRYRERLHVAGLVRGFQWLDGSFLEQIELLEERPPNDLDVVTFFHLPSGATQRDIQAHLAEAFPLARAERDTVKAVFHVDPYWVCLDKPPGALVRSSAFWYSMWSHRRDASWKGFVQIDLGDAKDAIAAAELRTPPTTGTRP